MPVDRNVHCGTGQANRVSLWAQYLTSTAGAVAVSSSVHNAAILQNFQYNPIFRYNSKVYVEIKRSV